MGKHLKVLTVSILFLMLGFAANRAEAQDTPKVEISGSYSYVRANLVTADGCCFNMHGGHGAVVLNVNNWLGWEGEVGIYKNGNVKDRKQDLRLVSFVFGPHFSYRAHRRFTPFVHVLLGGGHAGGTLYTTLGDNSSFNLVTGGGVDLNLGPHVAWRFAQADYYFTNFRNSVNDRQNNLRLSTGVVFHFGRR